MTRRLRDRLRWRRRECWAYSAALGNVAASGGPCDRCRELLAKQPAVVLKADRYPATAPGAGTT